MRHGYFDATGRLLVLAELPDGTTPGRHPGAAFAAEVPATLDANALFFDRAGGRVIARQLAPIASDRTTILANGADAARITGIPAGATIVRNDRAETITGTSMRVVAQVPETIEVRLDGRWTSGLVTIAAVDLATAQAQVRLERDRRLAASDWTMTSDAPLSVAQRALWTVYRRALRDLPSLQASVTIDTVVWPMMPA